MALLTVDLNYGMTPTGGGEVVEGYLLEVTNSSQAALAVNSA